MDDNQTSDKTGKSMLWGLIGSRNIDKIVPVVSNGFRIEQVFGGEEKLTNLIPKKSEFADEDFTIEEQLTRIWAGMIGYPMSDHHNMARVAQYYQVQLEDIDVAKEKYLEFLNACMLDINADEPGYEQIVKGLRKEIGTRLFSDIVRMLDYPRFPQEAGDSLALLAKMPLPVYITTSYHDFLERALINENKTPRTQMVFWEENRKYDDALDHYPDPLFVPTPQNPAVYHIFGMENYPGSLVLSEDDYMKFLASVVADTDTQNPIVPPRLRQSLASKHLLLLGYHLRDWEFRVLFRFIRNYRNRGGEDAKHGFFIQLKPKTESEHLVAYVKKYFDRQRFKIEWKSSDECVRELWQFYKEQQL